MISPTTWGIFTVATACWNSGLWLGKQRGSGRYEKADLLGRFNMQHIAFLIGLGIVIGSWGFYYLLNIIWP